MAKESKIKPGTRRKIEGRDHVWSGSKWVESMGFWTKDKTKTVKTKGGRQDYRLVDGKWVKSYGKKPGAGDSSKTKSTDSSKTKSTNTNKKRNALSIFSPKVWSNTKRNIAAVENPSGKTKSKNNLTFGQAVKASEGKRLVKGDKPKVPSSRDFSKKSAEGKTTSFKKGMEANKDSKATTSNIKKSTVHTRHYKTGEALGVMTRAQRRAYDKEAAAAGGKSFEERVAAYEKSSGHGKSHKRETLYKASQRPGSRTYKAEQAKKTEKPKPQRESITINKDKDKDKKKKRVLFEGLSKQFS